jgi:RHS repeat-associated protein
MPRSHRYVAGVFAAAILFCPWSSFGQVPQLGIPPYSTVAGGSDEINLANLSIHYTIPVFSRAGRGIPFSFPINLDNAIWSPTAFGSNGYPEWSVFFPFSGGAFAGVGAVFYSKATQTCLAGYEDEITYTQWTFYSYQDTTGATHPFNLIVNNLINNQGACAGKQKASASGMASDGSGISMAVTNSISAVVTLPNGTVINAPLVTQTSGNWGVTGAMPFTMTDSNGNRVTQNWNSGTLTFSNIEDTLGTTALTESTTSSSASFSYTSPHGAAATLTKSWVQYTVQTEFACPGIDDFPATNFNLLDTVTLPDGTYYKFTYEKLSNGNTTGRIASVRLPTGGTISYTYSGGTNGIACVDGGPVTLTRVTPDGTWTYSRYDYVDSYGDVMYSTTTVTDPQGNQTVYHFTGDQETERQVYTGTASGTPLETIITCYNGTSPPSSCPTVAYSVGIPSRITVYKSFNGGPQSEVDTYMNSYGLPTEKDEYDFGASTPTRKTSITYASIGNGVNDRPATVEVTDGSGNFASETTYAYDQDVNSLKASGASQLFPPSCSSGTCRGNLTTSNEYVTSTTYLSKTFTHWDTGQVYQATDVNSAVTTYTYGDCGNSLLTSVALPVGLSQSYAWNCTGAVKTSSTDENGKTSHTNYTTDPYFWRPNSTQDPLGNTTSLTYTGATQVESVLPVTSGSSADVLSTLDSLGRTYVTQKRQAPGSSNFDTGTTFYDSVGRPYRSTMPCQETAGVACPTTPATTTTYDGAGRPLQVQDAGGGTITYTYNQNDVLQQIGPAPSGENLKQRQFEYDGLGRLTSVCELTTVSGSSACGQTTAQTGYWTRYKYDAVGHLIGVCQNTTVPLGTDCVQSPSSGQQTRTYSYDALGRLTSESNPESGTTLYFYDSVSDGTCGPITSKGDLIESEDAKGDKPCYSHDQLHRLVSIGSQGPDASVTPDHCYKYDSATVNGVVMGNTGGRLAEAYTTAHNTGCGATKITDEGFVYDADGRQTEFYESTPNSGEYYHPTAAYWPNGALETLWISTLPTITYTPDGEGRTSTVSASSGQNPVTATSYNVASQVTNVTFGSGDADAFTYDANTGRMTQYEYTINGSSEFGIPSWNPNGSLKSLAITDPFNAGDNQTCNYSHDDLARIASVSCQPWSQTFTYDAFGNITKSGSISWQPGYNGSTNHYTLAGTSYDSDGNLLSDTFHSYTWNALGRPATIDSITRTYDAFDRLVEQNISGTIYQTVYDPTGEKLGVFSGSTIQQLYVPLPGGSAAEYYSGGLSDYRHSDWLGSDRLESSASNHSILDNNAYAPFGEPYEQSGNGEISFTGQNKDTVWLQYDFLARQYDPKQGRWISPDPAGLGAVDPTNPQTWNRYAYTVNDPLVQVDPLGLFNDAVTPQGDNGCIQTDSCQIYVVDGMQVSSQVALALLASGAAGFEEATVTTSETDTLPNHDKYQQSTVTTTELFGVSSSSSNAAAANNGGIDWTWWKTFVKEAVNPLPELREGGCGRVFLDAFAEGGLFPDGGPGTEPDSLITQAGSIAAAQYAVNQGLVVPLRSSIYRGILEGTETAASGAVLADVYTREAQGFNAEYSAFKAGACH